MILQNMKNADCHRNFRITYKYLNIKTIYQKQERRDLNEQLNKMTFIILHLSLKLYLQGNASLLCRNELLPLARNKFSQGNALLPSRYELLPLAKYDNTPQGNALLPSRYELLPLAKYGNTPQGNAFLPCRHELLPSTKCALLFNRNELLLLARQRPEPYQTVKTQPCTSTNNIANPSTISYLDANIDNALYYNRTIHLELQNTGTQADNASKIVTASRPPPVTPTTATPPSRSTTARATSSSPHPQPGQRPTSPEANLNRSSRSR